MCPIERTSNGQKKSPSKKVIHSAQNRVSTLWNEIPREAYYFGCLEKGLWRHRHRPKNRWASINGLKKNIHFQLHEYFDHLQWEGISWEPRFLCLADNQTKMFYNLWYFSFFLGYLKRLQGIRFKCEDIAWILCFCLTNIFETVMQFKKPKRKRSLGEMLSVHQLKILL